MQASRTIHGHFYRVIHVATVLSFAIFVAGCVPLSPPSFSVPETVSPVAHTTRTEGFVTRSGTQLMLNGHPFRFAGANMHWLGLDDSGNYPSQFRVDDGLDAAQEMGATVIRS